MNDDYYDFNDDDWNDYVEDDYDYDDNDDYLSDDDILDDNDVNNLNIKIPPRLWAQVKINNEIVEISSEGRIKYPLDLYKSSDGTRQEGTPYRYTKIGNKKYYMHELVWCTFNGKIPEGCEVRHKNEYVEIKKRKLYSNHLANITIYKKDICEVIPFEP
jgi:hypothetical protein